MSEKMGTNKCRQSFKSFIETLAYGIYICQKTWSGHLVNLRSFETNNFGNHNAPAPRNFESNKPRDQTTSKPINWKTKKQTRTFETKQLRFQGKNTKELRRQAPSSQETSYPSNSQPCTRPPRHERDKNEKRNNLVSVFSHTRAGLPGRFTASPFHEYVELKTKNGWPENVYRLNCLISTYLYLQMLWLQIHVCVITIKSSGGKMHHSFGTHFGFANPHWNTYECVVGCWRVSNILFNRCSDVLEVPNQAKRRSWASGPLMWSPAVSLTQTWPNIVPHWFKTDRAFPPNRSNNYTFRMESGN